MSRRAIKEFAIIICSLAVAIATTTHASAQSPPGPPNQQSPDAQKKAEPQQRGTEQAPFVVKIEQSEQDQKKSNPAGADGAQKGGNGWLAGWSLSDKIAAVAIVIGAFQFLAFVATVWVMMLNGRRQLRAYIANPDVAEIRGFDTERPITTLAFKNSGQTPAHDVDMWSSSGVAAFPLEEIPVRPPTAVPDSTGSVGVLGPGAVFHTEERPSAPMTDAERQTVIAGTGAYYVYGELRYRDVFGKPRLTTFCSLYRGAMAASPNGKLGTYYKWNKAT
jgi:hypothetical protein